MLWTKGDIAVANSKWFNLHQATKGLAQNRFESLPFPLQKVGHFLPVGLQLEMFSLVFVGRSTFISRNVILLSGMLLGWVVSLEGGYAVPSCLTKVIRWSFYLWTTGKGHVSWEKSVKSLWFRWNPPVTWIGKIYSWYISGIYCQLGDYIPIGSMNGIFTYIYRINQPNAGKYTIHGSSGISPAT